MKVTPGLIRKFLDEAVVGQEDVKDTLSICAYNQFLKYFCSKKPEWSQSPLPKNNLLITGPSGTGKTHSVAETAFYTGFPFLTIDAMSLVPVGYSGIDYIDQFKQWQITPSQVEMLPYAIIFIDEFDKITTAGHEHQLAAWYKQIQRGLLRLLEGTQIKVGCAYDAKKFYEVNTKDMLFVMAGAFVDHTFRQTKDVGIGFKSDYTSKSVNHSTVNHTELEELGIITELTGRINVVTHTTALTKSNIKSILVDTYNNLISQYDSMFVLGGLKIEDALTEDDIDDIVEQAYNSNFGARYLKNILFEHLKKAMFALGANVEYNMEDEEEESPDNNPLNLNTSEIL